MVSSTLCPAVHILGSQIVYSRAEGIADHYWPWAVFYTYSLATLVMFLIFLPQNVANIISAVDSPFSPPYPDHLKRSPTFRLD